MDLPKSNKNQNEQHQLWRLREENARLKEWTRWHLGGERPWFICPAPYCNHRMAVLYGFPDLACRICHSLSYRSQSETPGDRAARKANKIRRRLGWKPGILNETGGKPAGMHWNTFWKLYEQHNQMARITVCEISDKLGLIATVAAE